MDDTGGLTCYRCFKMVLRSPNVVQAHTAELGRCSVTEEGAVRDCPNDRDIAQGEAKEIILYREFSKRRQSVVVLVHITRTL